MFDVSAVFHTSLVLAEVKLDGALKDRSMFFLVVITFCISSANLSCEAIVQHFPRAIW